MKINDKYLIPFAKSANQVDKEGYLMKKGDKNFSQRYFVLKGNLLFYFEKKNDKEPLGVIILEGSTMELTESEFEQHYCFKIVFPSRSYTLSAESQSTMESWLKSLACGSVDYIKLMVAELERQLDETNIHSAATQNVFTSNRFNNSSSLNANVPIENVTNATVHRQHISTPPRHRHARQPTQNQKRAFSSLHNEFGDNIIRHQESRWSIHETNRPNRNIPPLSVVKQYGIIDF